MTAPATGKKNSILREAAMKVFPALQQKRIQSFGVVLLTLLALIVLGLFAINPTVTTIIQLNKQISDDTLVYNQLQTKIDALTTLQAKYETLQPDLSLVLEAIPDKSMIPKLLGQIQTLAVQNHTKISSLQAGPYTVTSAPPMGLGNFSFTAIVDGNRDDILHFISAFNSFDRMTTIQKVSLTESTSLDGSMEATVQGTAYFSPL